MKRKKQLLILTMTVFMVLSFSLMISDTLAYWRGPVLGSETQAVGTIQTGIWNQAFEWDPSADYLEGDIVINNGVRYRATRDNPDREPGVDSGWRGRWDVVD